MEVGNEHASVDVKDDCPVWGSGWRYGPGWRRTRGMGEGGGYQLGIRARLRNRRSWRRRNILPSRPSLPDPTIRRGLPHVRVLDLGLSEKPIGLSAYDC